MKKKLFNNSLFIIIILSLIIIFGLFLFTTNFNFIGKKSIHEDAKTYKTRHCMAFYPNADEGLSTAKALCKDVKDDKIFDYSLVPYGDYYLINYGNEYKYFTDKNYKHIRIEDVSDYGKKIAVDYLRYELKKNHSDLYYNADFLASTTYGNIDFSDVTFELVSEDVKFYFPQYNIEVYVPVKYLQREIGMDFGFRNILYRKPIYIDSNEKHPLICLTLDDGPEFYYESGDTTSEKIVNLFYKYDANATYYVIGYNLEDREYWADYQAYYFLRNSIGNGNEYGSHTQNHEDSLIYYNSSQEIFEEISGPIKYMKEFLDYDMKTYRPVSGEFNATVLDAQPLPAILWSIDSEDWLSRDANTICDLVLNSELDDGDIISFSDIYEETVEALNIIVPELINRGYQLITVSDMLSYYGIDFSSIKYFYNPYYYE